jgi:hypothetical protein
MTGVWEGVGGGGGGSTIATVWEGVLHVLCTLWGCREGGPGYEARSMALVR